MFLLLLCYMTLRDLSESTKPPNFKEHICGYALTVDNWNQNKIQIKATIDGRRDGDHRNTLDVVANVYNQPQTAQITVKPNSFTVSSVQVNQEKSHKNIPKRIYLFLGT